jgi:hypothetical protein
LSGSVTAQQDLEKKMIRVATLSTLYLLALAIFASAYALAPLAS